MKITTYTLWAGYAPLIDYIPQDSAKKNKLCHYRVAPMTMTQGAFPAHVNSYELAKELSQFHATDDEALEIVRNEICV